MNVLFLCSYTKDGYNLPYILDKTKRFLANTTAGKWNLYLNIDVDISPQDPPTIPDSRVVQMQQQASSTKNVFMQRKINKKNKKTRLKVERRMC